jgi:hypothetical protein
VATWSMFFGCKSTPLFERINAHRSQYDLPPSNTSWRFS